jgi:hypothetical protein
MADIPLDLNILVNEPSIAVRIGIKPSDSVTTLWDRVMNKPYQLVDQYSIYKLTNSIFPRTSQGRSQLFQAFHKGDIEAVEVLPIDVIGDYFEPNSIDRKHVHILILYRPRE